MRLKYRVSFNPKKKPATAEEFAKAGVELILAGKKNIAQLAYFDIVADDKRWPAVKAIMERFEIAGCKTVEFETEEILAADWAAVAPKEPWGTPVLDDAGLWRQHSFDTANWCSACGQGSEQKRPLHVQQTFSASERKFIAVEGLYELFTCSNIAEELTRECVSGFEALDVLYGATREPVPLLKQIAIRAVLPPAILNQTRKRYSCGHEKIVAFEDDAITCQKGAFAGAPHLVRSHEWVGVGRAADRLIIASSRFTRLYFERGWKGLSFHPLRLL